MYGSWMDEKHECPDCEGSLEARLRDHAATLAAQDDQSTVYVRELLEEAAQAATPKTCSTCKHWRKNEWTGNSTGEVHRYPDPRWDTEFEHRFCQLLEPYRDNSDIPRDGARASYDDSGLETGPDFGCIHHEPLPSNEDSQ